MQDTGYLNIAGLAIPLVDVQGSLADLSALMAEFDQRGADFRRTGDNPHLCRAGCSHCCRSGAVFAVTLVEAVAWADAGAGLEEPFSTTVRQRAADLVHLQHAVFADGRQPVDHPGQRDEASFSRRVSALNQAHPACPMLSDDLCSIYAQRPLLCRAYGFPVDAFSVESGNAIIFRSLCHLYEGMRLTDYVRARDIRARLAEISIRVAGGRDWGRFTSVEAALATLRLDSDARSRLSCGV